MILTTLIATTALAPRLLMAHYMPWFESKPLRGSWGWHWTMGKMDPDNGEVASKYRPLIGAYDSRDPDVIEYQLLTMKLAGIDGVFVDWYGINNLYDYAAIHAASQMMFAATKKLGMKFGVVYEDQTVKSLIEKQIIAETDAVANGRKTIEWLAANWFPSPHYVRADGRPALLVFGPQYYKPGEWPTILQGLDASLFTLHHRVGPAVGGYDWPIPKDGDEGVARERKAFADRAKDWTTSISVAYPRFQDFYQQAGVHDSYGSVSDDDGGTFTRTLTEAMTSTTPMVQIATWNDWGEGTQIEPSEEFGYRDLVATQALRKKLWEPGFRFDGNHLKLPAKLFAQRKLQKAPLHELEGIANQIAAGNVGIAGNLLSKLKD